LRDQRFGVFGKRNLTKEPVDQTNRHDRRSSDVAIAQVKPDGRILDQDRHALDAIKALEAAYGAKFGKATAKITDDIEELLAFSFATVRHRTKVTKGPVPAQPDSPWRSSSSSPHKPAGVP
jgi:hypothetical protein